MIDAMFGNDNTKIVKLLDLIWKKLEKIEKKVEGLYDGDL
jgi:hypothetical protein